MKMIVIILAVVIVLAIAMGNTKKKKIHTQKADYLENALAKEKKRRVLAESYKSVLAKHEKLREMIGVKYTVAREKNGFVSKEMDEVVALCKKDIELAGDVIDYYRRDGEIAGFTIDPRAYMDTFQRLAIIYEKQGKYKEAIEICKKALQYGIKNDGTQGGMVGRIARLENKQKKGNQLHGTVR